MSEVTNWPLDENGAPMAKVSWALGETINLGNYSNVKVGPGEVTRFVKDTDKDRAEGLVRCMDDVEEALGQERQKILDHISSQKEKSK